MTEDRVFALLLAAGQSRRMGAFKPLLPFGGRTVLETLIFTYRKAGVSDLLVVLGHRAAEVRPVLNKLGVASVFNEHYPRGMFSSIQCGVRNLPPSCGAFFLQPADMPGLQPETIRLLVAARGEKDALVLHPCHEGRRGHPPLVSTSLVPAVLAFDEPGGMRTLLSRYQQKSLNIECGDPGILSDLDNREDYEAMLRQKGKID